MDYFSLIGIAIGLAMDAFAVSVTNGAITKNIKPKFAIKIGLSFGLFQMLMPIIGWLVGKASEKLIANIDHFIAFILLGYIGGNMIIESCKKREYKISKQQKQNDIELKTLLTLSLATSIDALATGVILPSSIGAETVCAMLSAVLIIGAITFILSFIGVYIGKYFGSFISKSSGTVGGIVLIIIGTKILVKHILSGI